LVDTLTSLTGGTVDIYVENKTTLTGAVIASVSGDLTLDTGSFEYSHIKDKDYSSNLGGGVNVETDSKSVNVTYGFTDTRQTNFATIGEGTITVRDASTGSATGLEGLNRDVSISQYNTKDGGLQGGFTVDTATVNLVVNSVDTVTNTLVAIADGYKDAKETTGVLYNEAGVAIEKTGNLIEHGHFATDTNPLVQVARVSEQMDDAGIDRSNSDLTFINSGVITRDDGQVFQIQFDEKGRLYLVDSGFNENNDLTLVGGYAPHNAMMMNGQDIGGGAGMGGVAAVAVFGATVITEIPPITSDVSGLDKPLDLTPPNIKELQGTSGLTGGNSSSADNILDNTGSTGNEVPNILGRSDEQISVWNFIFGSSDVKRLDKKELTNRLGTENIHQVKDDIKKDFGVELKKLGWSNPDIGVNSKGNTILIDRVTGKTFDTNIPLDSYKTEKKGK